MGTVLTSCAILFGLTAVFGTILALAYRWLHVEDDPRVEVVDEQLPGNNCGACGQPGCRAFAEALVEGKITPGKCTVSTPEALQEIASFLGIDAAMEEKRVARLHCAGGKSSVRKLADYHGISSCRGAFVVNGGGRACAWGCLGLADCSHACTFDAIVMNDENLPVVITDKCTACGDCVDACPVNLFSLEPISNKLVVQCSSPLAAEAARSACKVACDACGRCAMDSPAGSIEMKGGLPMIREPQQVTVAATFRCPTGAIQWIEKDQFAETILGGSHA